ncbi:MAG TPA: MFS transporter [Myxococcaceae bacterium]|jgi:predicted MFS family arabinose efflux permease
MSETKTRGAGFSLGVLTLVNLLNYLDRYIVAGVVPRVQAEFGLNNTQAGALGTVFVLVYMVASPVGGFLGDRIQRRHVVAGSVFLWSLATVGSGLAGTYVALLGARAVLGVGEAGYGSVGPAIISDLYPRDRRTRMLAIFFVALPVGAALGYAVGGWIGATYSWRLAFFIGGAPGLVLAFLMLFTPEPARGATETEPVVHEKIPFAEGLRRLRPNRVYWAATAGLTAVTFAMGGLGYWMPKFLEAERGIDPGRAGFLFGAVTAVAGLAGTMLGGVLGDRADRRRQGGGLWVSGMGMIAGAPFMVLAATVQGEAAIYAAAFAAELLLFMNTAPINAAIVNSIPPSYRTFAIGVSNLMLHALGDAISPSAIGAVADASSVAMAIRANALPVVLGGLILAWGARQARLAGAGAATAPAS